MVIVMRTSMGVSCVRPILLHRDQWELEANTRVVVLRYLSQRASSWLIQARARFRFRPRAGTGAAGRAAAGRPSLAYMRGIGC